MPKALNLSGSSAITNSGCEGCALRDQLINSQRGMIESIEKENELLREAVTKYEEAIKAGLELQKEMNKLSRWGG